MTQTLNKLTEKKIREVTTCKRCLLGDGGGLALQLTPQKGGSTAKSWIFRFQGRTMGIGAWPAKSLTVARAHAAELREAVARGIDVIDARNARRAAIPAARPASVTFEWCLLEHVRAKRREWRSAQHASEWEQSVRTHAKALLERPVDAITAADVLDVLKPVWLNRTVTASRVRGRLAKVFGWAMANGFRARGPNPAAWTDGLEHSLASPSKAHKVERHAALPWQQMPAFVDTLRKTEGTVARGLEFLVLTCVRLSDVINARCEDIDVDAKIWAIPAGKTKNGDAHVVPLSEGALRILGEMSTRGRKGFVFPGFGACPTLSKAAMWRLLKALGYDQTVHGFRSNFAQWAANNGQDPMVADMCLQHRVGDPVFRAYQRSTLLDKRRELLKAWDVFCSSHGSVVVLKSEAA
jgi:integrase